MRNGVSAARLEDARTGRVDDSDILTEYRSWTNTLPVGSQIKNDK
jgi:hypothetical protein